MADMSIEALKELIRGNRLPAGTPIEEARANMDAASLPVAPDIKIEAVEIAGRKAEWLEAPDADPSRATLYFHGGGYVLGSLASHRSMVAEIARASRSRALLFDYRLAPESPYPAAVDDALAAYRWLRDQNLAHLAIAGDSAGGGLTLACMLAARDQGLPMPDAAVCISPWTDLTCSAETYESRAHLDPLIPHIDIQGMVTAYLQGASAEAPTASPNFADLSGLPPLLIHVGTDECLYSDSIVLHDRAKTTGVASTLDVWPDMIHVWHSFHPMLKEARLAISRVGEFLDKTWES